MASNDPTSRRLELRGLNQRAWSGEDVFTTLTKLDSSLKKNTGFIKKIRSFLTPDGCLVGLKEISTLSLEKYLSEITSSLAENLSKVSKSDDIFAAAEILSALHQRFQAQIVLPLLSLLVNSITSKDPSSLLSQRNLLRILFEMHLIGICSNFEQCDKEGLSDNALRFYAKYSSDFMIIPLLKDTLAFDISEGFAFPIVSSFLKRFNAVLDSPLVEDDLKKQLKQIFMAFTRKLTEFLLIYHKDVCSMTESNRKQSIRMGRILEESVQQLEEKTQIRDLFLSNVNQLCDLLGMEKPSLELVTLDDSESVVIRTGEDETKGWWDDIRERDFYNEVPSYDLILKKFETDKVDDRKYSGLTDGESVVLFLQRLENVVTEEELDKLTAEMHMFVPYKKATKNKILRFFAEVEKSDNINLYARFLKINLDFFPDLVSDLIDLLDKGFRSQIYLGKINFKNLAFFIELVKFKLIPSHIVFHKLRRMTLNISENNNVEILLIFYERCGKFLLFEPEFLGSTKEMLELLRNQSKSEKLSVTEKLSLSNMFLIVNSFNSPPKAVVQQELLSPIEDFVTQMIKRSLFSTNAAKLTKLTELICFNSEASDVIVSLFMKPEELAADKYDALATFLRELVSEHEKSRHILVRIIDGLSEKIVRGLELNDYRHNVSRTAQVKLIGAFFNGKILNSHSVVELLYKIICFGYPNNLPLPNNQLLNDARDNYMRISLSCALLKSINFKAVKKANSLSGGVKSVEGFLVFFQYYIFCKAMPLPQEVSFLVDDVFAKFAQYRGSLFERLGDLRTAMQLLQKYNLQHQGIPQTDDAVDSDESISADELDDGVEDEFEDDEVIDDEVDEEGDEEESSESDISDQGDDLASDADYSLSESTDEEDDELERYVPLSERNRIEDEKFARALDSTINELRSSDYNKGKAVPLRVPAPFGVSAHGGNFDFAFLSKGNDVRQVTLPSDNRFSQRILHEQAAAKANRQKILSLINNMEI